MQEIVWNSIAWSEQNKVLLLGLALIIGTAIFTSPPMKRWEWLDFIPKRRGRNMRRARRQFVDDMLTSDFTNLIETRVYHGAITRDEAKEIYRKLKQLFPIRNLFPAPHLLKEAIKKRREAGIHDPVNLPDPQPKRKLKHVFDKPKRVTL